MEDDSAVNKLLQLMREDNKGVSKVADLAEIRKAVAGVVAATQNETCLNRFITQGGLKLLDKWLQDVHKGTQWQSNSLSQDGGHHKAGGSSWSSSNETRGTPVSQTLVDEVLLDLLKALARLPIGLEALKSCVVGKSVNQLRSHRNSEVGKRARRLVDAWKKKVDETLAGTSAAPPAAPSTTAVTTSAAAVSARNGEDGKRSDKPARDAGQVGGSTHTAGGGEKSRITANAKSSHADEVSKPSDHVDGQQREGSQQRQQAGLVRAREDDKPVKDGVTRPTPRNEDGVASPRVSKSGEDRNDTRKRDAGPSRQASRERSPLDGRERSPLVGRERKDSPFQSRDASPMRGSDKSPVRGRDRSPMPSRDDSPLKSPDHEGVREREKERARKMEGEMEQETGREKERPREKEVRERDGEREREREKGKEQAERARTVEATNQEKEKDKATSTSAPANKNLTVGTSGGGGRKVGSVPSGGGGISSGRGGGEEQGAGGSRGGGPLVVKLAMRKKSPVPSSSATAQRLTDMRSEGKRGRGERDGEVEKGGSGSRGVEREKEKRGKGAGEQALGREEQQAMAKDKNEQANTVVDSEVKMGGSESKRKESRRAAKEDKSAGTMERKKEDAMKGEAGKKVEGELRMEANEVKEAERVEAIAAATACGRERSMDGSRLEGDKKKVESRGAERGLDNVPHTHAGEAAVGDEGMRCDGEGDPQGRDINSSLERSSKGGCQADERMDVGVKEGGGDPKSSGGVQRMTSDHHKGNSEGEVVNGGELDCLPFAKRQKNMPGSWTGAGAGSEGRRQEGAQQMEGEGVAAPADQMAQEKQSGGGREGMQGEGERTRGEQAHEDDEGDQEEVNENDDRLDRKPEEADAAMAMDREEAGNPMSEEGERGSGKRSQRSYVSGERSEVREEEGKERGNESEGVQTSSGDEDQEGNEARKGSRLAARDASNESGEDEEAAEEEESKAKSLSDIVASGERQEAERDGWWGRKVEAVLGVDVEDKGTEKKAGRQKGKQREEADRRGKTGITTGLTVFCETSRQTV